MKPFKTVDSNDLAFFESVMPGRVFAGEDISPDYDHCLLYTSDAADE